MLQPVTLEYGAATRSANTAAIVLVQLTAVFENAAAQKVSGAEPSCESAADALNPLVAGERDTDAARQLFGSRYAIAGGGRNQRRWHDSADACVGTET